MFARFTATTPSFWVPVSLHHQKYYSSPSCCTESITKAYYLIHFRTLFEANLKKSVGVSRDNNTQILLYHPNTHGIDVGGNIGWHTLLSMAVALEQNRSVVFDIFEPNPRNDLRFCESLHLNDWLSHDQVVANLYAVGVTSEKMANAATTRMGRMDISKAGEGSLDDVSNSNNRTETVEFPLDQMGNELYWMAPDHIISILRVDVEGFELEVLEGAQQLLKSQRVQNIFLEGNVEKEDGDKFRRLVELSVKFGYAAYKLGGYRGPKDPVESNWTASSTSLGPVDFTSLLLNYTTSLLNQCQGTTTRAKKRRICNYGEHCDCHAV